MATEPCASATEQINCNCFVCLLDCPDRTQANPCSSQRKHDDVFGISRDFFYLPLVHLEIYKGAWMEMKSECQEKVFANEDLGKTVYSVPKLIEFIIYMVIINH